MKKEKHIANIELAERIRYEIDHFFDAENEQIYSKYFTAEEANQLRFSNYGKKNTALIKLLSKELEMSEKTFYHMFNGKNSQFDKVARVVEFFGLELRYNIYVSNDRLANFKKGIILGDSSTVPSKTEETLIDLIFKLDDDSKESLIAVISKFKEINE